MNKLKEMAQNISAKIREDEAENSIMQTISVAISAILIAAGLVQAPNIINNARDSNARQDLANIAYAQQFNLANNGAYHTGISAIESDPELSIVFSTGVEIGLAAGTTGYVAIVESLSGKLFVRTADSTATREVDATTAATLIDRTVPATPTVDLTDLGTELGLALGTGDVTLELVD